MDKRYRYFILIIFFFYVSYCLYPKPSLIPTCKINYLKKMVYHRIPFIIKGGAMDLDAFKKWNDEYLRKIIGNKDFMVEKSYSNIFSPDDPNSKAGRVSMNFNKFSKKYIHNKFEKGNKTHLNYYFAEVEVPKILRKDLRNPYLKAFERPAKEINMFLGVGGNVTRTHYDSYENFYFLLDGSKEISLISPYFNKYLYIPKEKKGEDSNYLNVNVDNIDYKKYPLMKKVKILSFKLEKGDMLYIPYNWWHFVKSGMSRNLAVSFWF
jgi:hypothetical protein